MLPTTNQYHEKFPAQRAMEEFEESSRQRAEREERERTGALLSEAREALSERPNSKKLQERVRKLNAAMNLLQRR
jgi:hypothetical protein